MDLLAQRDLELAADLTPDLERRRKELAAAYDATQAEIAKLDTARKVRERLGLGRHAALIEEIYRG